MAFPDPVSVKIGANTFALNRITTGGTDGHFVDSTNMVELAIVPSTTKAGRQVNAARLSVKKVTSDPLVTTTNVMVNNTVTIAFNKPQSGFTPQEIIDSINALLATLTGSSNALLTKLIGLES